MVGKLAIAGLLERRFKVYAKVTGTNRRKRLHPKIKEHVETGLAADTRTRSDRIKNSVRITCIKRYHHVEKYVDGHLHTEGMGKLLVAAKTRSEGNLHQRGTVPPISLPGRTGLPLQYSQR